MVRGIYMYKKSSRNGLIVVCFIRSWAHSSDFKSAVIWTNHSWSKNNNYICNHTKNQEKGLIDFLCNDRRLR